jgi:uncharacterized membrane protein required for colicin V production
MDGMDPGLSILFIVAGWAGWLLYAGLNPWNKRRWYDRSWRVIAAAFISYLAVLFFFGDS